LARGRDHTRRMNDWSRGAALYQIYPRSFRDADGVWVNEAWRENSPLELVIRVNGGLRKLEVIEN